MGVTGESSFSTLPRAAIVKRRRAPKFLRYLVRGSKRLFGRRLFPHLRIGRASSPEWGLPIEHTSAVGFRSQVPEGLRQFSYDEVKEFTDGFSEANCLGETDSTYSMVYRGRIPIDRERNLFKDVIVETWKASHTNRNIWQAQIELIRHGSIGSHPNVVKFYGCCNEGQFLGFIYDCQALGTVRSMNLDERFTWSRRIKAALQVSDVLRLLHKEGIVVCNLEPGSILLDKDFNPVVFGLGKASGGFLGYRASVGHPIIITSWAFSDPRFSCTGCIEPSCDMYSFGALLLMLITKSEETVDYISPLKSFLLETFGSDDFSLESYTQDLVQSCFGDKEEYNSDYGNDIIKLAMQCVAEDESLRPSIDGVVNCLNMLLMQYLRLTSPIAF